MHDEIFITFAGHPYIRQTSQEIPSPTKTPISSRYSPTTFKYDDDVHRHSISPPHSHSRTHSPPTLVRSDVVSYHEQFRMKLEASNIHHTPGHIELCHTR